MGDRVVDEAVDVEGLVLPEGVDHRRRRVGQEDHVGFLDLLEPPDRGAVEAEALGEHVVGQFMRRSGEVLHHAREVTEADIDDLDALVLDEAEHIGLGSLCHRSASPLRTTAVTADRMILCVWLLCPAQAGRRPTTSSAGAPAVSAPRTRRAGQDPNPSHCERGVSPPTADDGRVHSLFTSSAPPATTRRPRRPPMGGPRGEPGRLAPCEPADYVLRTVEERGIRFVQLWFTDVLGTPKGFNITPAELENALDEGMTFDGSAIDGFSRVQEADVLARPDSNTFQLLPWHGSDPAVARVFCDIFNLDGTPFEGCPRHTLRRTLERATPAGYTFFVAPEVEYFYFADADPSHPPTPLDAGSLLRPDRRRRVERPAPALGAHARGDGHPGRARPARGRPQPARDRPALHRRPHHGRHGDDRPPGGQGDRPPRGRARQLHAQARWPACRARACTPTSRCGRASRTPSSTPTTPTASRRWPDQFIAGLLRHAREITAVTNQWVNSYKRLVGGYEAPVHVSWARNNRSALVRVPVVKRARSSPPGSSTGRRTAPATPTWPSPSILAAGLRGIEQGYELPAEADANLFSLTARRARRQGHRAPAHQPQRRRRRDGAVEPARRHPGRARLRVVHPQQAGGVGRATRPTSPSSSSTATCPSCDQIRGPRARDVPRASPIL